MIERKEQKVIKNQDENLTGFDINCSNWLKLAVGAELRKRPTGTNALPEWDRSKRSGINVSVEPFCNFCQVRERRGHPEGPRHPLLKNM